MALVVTALSPVIHLHTPEAINTCDSVLERCFLPRTGQAYRRGKAAWSSPPPMMNGKLRMNTSASVASAALRQALHCPLEAPHGGESRCDRGKWLCQTPSISCLPFYVSCAYFLGSPPHKLLAINCFCPCQLLGKAQLRPSSAGPALG